MHGLETIRKMNEHAGAKRPPQPGEIWRSRDGSTTVFIRKTGRALAGIILQHPDEELVGAIAARELDGRYDNAKLHPADLVDYLGTLPKPGEPLGR